VNLVDYGRGTWNIEEMFPRIAAAIALTALVACKGEIGQSGDRGGPPAVDPILAIESGARRLSQSELYSAKIPHPQPAC